MIVRLLVEIEMNNEKLAEQLGEKLAEVTASGVIQQSIAQRITTLIGGPQFKDVQVTIVPPALRGDLLR